VEFKILNFEWLEGPDSSKGKPLKLIKRLSSQMLESSEVIANIIEKKLSERLTSEELEKWIASLIPTLMIGRLPLRINTLSLRLSQISIQPSILTFDIGYALQISDGPSNLKVKVSFGEIAVIQPSTLTITEELINKLLLANIGLINELMSSSLVKIEGLSLMIQPQVLQISIVPSRFTKKPIELLLKLNYQPELGLIELLDCQISANEEDGIIIRSLLRLISGKIEDAIEQYFPLDPIESLKVLMANISDQSPIKLHFDNLHILDMRLMEEKLSLLLQYSMQIGTCKVLPDQ
jgi:hypothetical protein